MWRPVTLASLLWVWCVAAVYAQAQPQSPEHWLQRMSESHRQLDYLGKFTYEADSNIASLRVAHAWIDGQQRESLHFLSGVQREVHRQGDQLHCVEPAKSLVRQFWGGHSALAPSYDFTQLSRFYRLSGPAPDRVADRDVVVLELAPRDTHRWQYRFFIDREQGLLLRSDVLGDRQSLLERLQFVEISFDREQVHQALVGQQIVSERPAQSGGETAVNAERVAPLWQPGWLPGGFASVHNTSHPSAIAMRSYSDGLSTVSVFLEPLAEDDSGEGQQQKGATVAYSRAQLIGERSYRVTVVGDIPLATAKLIAQSVQMGEAP